MSNNLPLNETTYPAIVGRILAAHREERQIEQSDIANQIGVSQSTWSRIERGETALTVEALARAAKVLGVSSSSVLDDADRAKEGLAQMDVKVLMDRPRSGGETALLLLSGAVLGFLIAKALAK